MKKVIAILLCCVMAFGMAACGGSTSAPAASDSGSASSPTAPAETSGAVKDSISIAVDGDCGSLDAYTMTGGNFFPVYICYQESLWENDLSDPNAPIATKFILAESVDIISETEYLIHLREGVTFSNGNPFTAEDVMFTFEYILTLPSRSYYIPFIDMEKSVIEDDHTIRLFLTQYDKTQLISLQDLPILDAESYDPAEAATKPVGTGPYVVTDYVVNSYVTLEARDDYWGDEVAIKHVTFKNIPESSQKTTALETGEVDVITVCPNEDVSYLQSKDGIQIVQKPTAQSITMYMNCSENSPLNSVEARLALAYACDRQAIIDVAYQGNGIMSTCAFSSGAVDYIPELANRHDTYSHGYDMELAKQYAEQAGLVGKNIRICTNGTGAYPVVAQIIQQALIELGVNATVTNYDTATASNMMAAEDDSWDVFIYYIVNPSGNGLDMMYGILGKFNWSRTFNLAETEYFRSAAEAALAMSDTEEYNAALLDYMSTIESFCPYFNICDVVASSAAVDNLDYGYYGTYYFNVAEWSFK